MTNISIINEHIYEEKEHEQYNSTNRPMGVQTMEVILHIHWSDQSFNACTYRQMDEHRPIDVHRPMEVRTDQWMYTDQWRYEQTNG